MADVTEVNTSLWEWDNTVKNLSLCDEILAFDWKTNAKVWLWSMFDIKLAQEVDVNVKEWKHLIAFIHICDL